MKLYSIQYLRAVAALGVVAYHAAHGLPGYFQQTAFLDIGVYGVDLFFVISGFIIFNSTSDGDIGVVDFLIRRLIRVWPLYLVLTTLAFALALTFPQFDAALSPNPWDFARSVLFMPFYNSRVSFVAPVLAQGWTLNFEMFFYLVFGLSLLLRRPVLRLLACSGTLLTLSIVGATAHPSDPALATYTQPINLEFVLGVALGYCMNRHPNQLGRVVGFFVTAAVTIVTFRCVSRAFIPEFFIAGIPSAAIVGLALLLERANRVPKMLFLLLIGDASYSLYLSHSFVLVGLEHLWPARPDAASLPAHWMFIAVGASAATLGAICLFLMAERPITRTLVRMTHQRVTRTPA